MEGSIRQDAPLDFKSDRSFMTYEELHVSPQYM